MNLFAMRFQGAPAPAVKKGGADQLRLSALSQEHPCYGCGNYHEDSPCVGPCQKELNRWLAERRATHETGYC